MSHFDPEWAHNSIMTPNVKGNHHRKTWMIFIILSTLYYFISTTAYFSSTLSPLFTQHRQITSVQAVILLQYNYKSYFKKYKSLFSTGTTFINNHTQKQNFESCSGFHFHIILRRPSFNSTFHKIWRPPFSLWSII